MNYRELGKTGLMVGEIGIGCEGFVDKSYEQVKEFVEKMRSLGMTPEEIMKLMQDIIREETL